MPSQDILDKKIKNPDTGREIKVSSALNYDDNTAVKKKALQLIKKSEKETTSNKSTSEKPVTVKSTEKKSLKPKSKSYGISKECVEFLKQKGLKELNVLPQSFVKPEEIVFNTNGNKNDTWVCKFPKINPRTGEKMMATAYTKSFMKKSQIVKYKKLSKIKEEDIHKLEDKTSSLLRHKEKSISDSAAVIKIMLKTGLRVGSVDESETGNLGTRTLKRENITFDGDKTNLRFIGKSYQENIAQIDDKVLTNYLKETIVTKRPNERIFSCSYPEVMKVMDKINPKGINPKDLRTYKATKVAKELLESTELGVPPPLPKESTEIKKLVKEKLNKVFAKVAEILNNTPAMAKNSYVHPIVIVDYLKNLGLKPQVVGYKHITLEGVQKKQEIGFKDLEELTPLINSIRLKFKTSKSGYGDCGIVSLELFKRLPEKFKDFKLYAVWVKGLEEDHVLLTNGKYIIDPTGSQYNNPLYDLKSGHSDYKNWLRLDKTMIKDIEEETKATLKHRGITLKEDYLSQEEKNHIVENNFTSMDSMLEKYSDKFDNYDFPEITEEDLYECEEYPIPSWFFDENIELVRV